jgi:hypothetical protein
MDVGLEVNTEKTKYVIMTHLQNAGQKHGLLIANKFFENVGKFMYLGTKVTNQNCFHKEVKSSLNSTNAFYYSTQSFFPSCLLSKNLNISTYKTIILSVFCMGVKLSHSREGKNID